jgi:uncharacterized protein YbcV (DUF1398 family)
LNTQVLDECEFLSFQGKIAFPEVVARLAASGVERYCADLVKLEKFYYSPEGQSHIVAMPLADAPAIGREFSANAVRAAVRDSQKGEIGYPEFLKRIMAAGTVYYDVFVGGRKVIYTGRDGDFHVENFPAKQ